VLRERKTQEPQSTVYRGPALRKSVGARRATE